MHYGVGSLSFALLLCPLAYETYRLFVLRNQFQTSLLESNVNILERDCKVAQLFLDAAASRKNYLYLGLDVSTQSTGYAVLRPSTARDSDHPDHDYVDAAHPKRFEVLREVGEANLVEWGYISGNGSDGKKGDEVDVGVLVEETLVRVAARCGRTTRDGDKTRPAPSPSLSVEPSELEESGRGLGVMGATAGALGCPKHDATYRLDNNVEVLLLSHHVAQRGAQHMLEAGTVFSSTGCDANIPPFRFFGMRIGSVQTLATPSNRWNACTHVCTFRHLSYPAPSCPHDMLCGRRRSSGSGRGRAGLGCGRGGLHAQVLAGEIQRQIYICSGATQWDRQVRLP